MNKNIEFLNYIYQNSQMGIIGIDDIISKVDDEKFNELLVNQKKEYQNICNESVNIFIKYGREEKDITPAAKASSFVMAKMKLLVDNSTSNIAKMMIEGSNKGITMITEKLNHYDNTDEDIKSLGEKLLKTENHNLEELKKYL